MAKCLVFFISSLMVPVFIVGCHSTKSERAEHIEPEAIKFEPIEAKPNAPESDDIIPYGGISGQFEPDNIESIEIELDNVKPVIIDKHEPKQGSVRPDKPENNSAAAFHDKCAEVLNDFVDEKGMVDYKRLRRQRLKLKDLLLEFDKLEPSEYKKWSKENKIAFWLNAYNIQMLKIIADNYPIQSSRILRLYPGWGPKSILHIKGLWTDYKFLVMDEEFTLSEIDKRFFRKEFDDPRIFFAVSRGSMSSPPLRNEPYYGHRLNKQLDEQVKRFLSSPLALQINTEKQRVYLSSLFQPSSYGKEFIRKFIINKKFKTHDPTTRAVLNFITNYVSKDLVSFLEVGNYSIQYIKYDWTINDGSYSVRYEP
ncbi:MAG: DUF547 domain-containing protein [Planctomycetes bacterium]|nr:DUF547 domain-containing protein [Planctomycetota bacterium]